VVILLLGDRVVATDISATYPVEADQTPKIGYQAALSAEPIVAFDPTVVLATDLAGPPETLEDLERLGVAVVVVPSPETRAGPGIKIRAVAGALGVPERGEALAAEVERAMDEAVDRVEAVAGPVGSRPRIAALYLRGENVQLLLGDESPVDWIIEAAGAVNVADELGVDDADHINAEAMVAAAPDVLLVPSLGLESVGGLDGLLALPWVAETPAGEAGRVLAYEDQYLLGNGPRSGELLAELVADLYENPE
jgi:iron complex transport system substrate-binding protein